jgi:hypothetical protein
MKTHVLRIAADISTFTPLFKAMRAIGLRVGWLELGAVAGVPPTLEAAAALGALRAVAVGGGRSVAVKPLRGAPVLKDLLQEHFRGCALVLVQGEVAAPLLIANGDAWRLSLPDGTERHYATVALAEALRRPKPF